MPRNIEIKARVADLPALALRVAAIADRGPTEIAQDDTFFSCPDGRLKLRAFSSAHGELIFYRRANREGPEESFYVLSPTSSPDTLREALTHAYGQAGRVQKHRTLFLVGRTRVHLDDVSELGQFLELEVVLEEGESAGSGVAEANSLMTRLGVEQAQLVSHAYVDLMSNRGALPALVPTAHRSVESPMEDTSILKTDASLAEFLRARALATSSTRLALDLVGGALVAGVASWARPAGWHVLASAGLCFSLYAVWAFAERRLRAESRDMRMSAEFAWLAARTSAAGLGLAALMAFLFSLLRLALGTWIS